jgi:hypothetical protein
LNRVEDERVLVYDHVDSGGTSYICREPDEDEENYRRRLALYDSLFDRRS